MTDQDRQKKKADERPDWNAMRNMHQMFLEALRHREQEILHFLAILAPALGGFIWLTTQWPDSPLVFVIGTYWILLALFIGAMYALSLGYNFRYLTLQLAKLESPAFLNIKTVMLCYWPREPQAFINSNRIGVIPWCTPPGIIKVFWGAFLASIAGVSVSAWLVAGGGSAGQTDMEQTLGQGLLMAGALALAVGFLWPIQVGRKILKAARDEDPDEWNARADSIQSTESADSTKKDANSCQNQKT